MHFIVVFAVELLGELLALCAYSNKGERQGVRRTSAVDIAPFCVASIASCDNNTPRRLSPTLCTCRARSQRANRQVPIAIIQCL